MKTTRVVSHVWAGRFPQYASFLRYQIDSLIRCYDETKGGVTFTVYYCAGDEKTVAVLQAARSVDWESIGWKAVPLTLPELGRRSIGRNSSAIMTREDFVFFTDVDHLFQANCFHQIPLQFEEAGNRVAMIYPREIQIHREHVIGDRVAGNLDLSLVDVMQPEFFEPKHYNRAIGGVQIVRGEFARKYGYLHGSKWNQPTLPPFADFRDDVAYRHFCSDHGEIRKVDLPGIYRLRHTCTTYKDSLPVTE